MEFFERFFRKKAAPSRPQDSANARREPVETLAVDFPHEVFRLPVEHAERELLRLRMDLAPEGRVPVIIGTQDDLLDMSEVIKEARPFEDPFKSVLSIDVGKWVATHMSDREACEVLEDRVFEEGAEPMLALNSSALLRQGESGELLVAAIRTQDQWMIPIHLEFGGWNSCPNPEIHAAFARCWEIKYGARLATMARDIVEFTVSSPPKSDAECMELARQQFIYCNDIVDQGVGSVPTLAKALRNSTRWFFWWD